MLCCCDRRRPERCDEPGVLRRRPRESAKPPSYGSRLAGAVQSLPQLALRSPRPPKSPPFCPLEARSACRYCCRCVAMAACQASKYYGTIKEMKRGRGLAAGHSIADIGLQMSMPSASYM